MRRAQGNLCCPHWRDGRADRENHNLTEQKPLGTRAGPRQLPPSLLSSCCHWEAKKRSFKKSQNRLLLQVFPRRTVFLSSDHLRERQPQLQLPRLQSHLSRETKQEQKPGSTDGVHSLGDRLDKDRL